MPQISAYTAATAVTDDDVFLGNDGSTTKKIPASVARTYFGSATVTFVTKSASWTLALNEAECFYLDDNASTHNITIPTNATVAIPVGTSYSGQQRVAGATATFVSTGVTLDVRNSTVQTAGQHAAWTLLKTGTDRWFLTGDLV